MARARDPNRDKAFEIYKEHNGDIPLKDIAAQLNKGEGTVRGWKNKDDWEGQLNGTLQSNERNAPIKKQRNKSGKKIVESEEVITFDTEGEDGLNDKQRLFVAFYVKCWNATKAYKKAYGCDYATANANGSRLLANASIREEIIKVRDSITDDALLNKRVLIQKWMDIAFADITDYVQFGREEEIEYDDEGYPKLDANGNPKTYTFSYVRLNDSAEVDGTLITEVKQGKDGISIKLADKVTALKYLSQHLDVLNEREKKWLQEEQMRLNNDKTKAEITRIEKQNEAGDQESTEEKLAEYFTALQGVFTNEPTEK